MINNEIQITLPTEFHQMDPEEKKRIYAMSAVIPDWSAHDTERHMIFSASWKQMNVVLAGTIGTTLSVPFCFSSRPSAWYYTVPG